MTEEIHQQGLADFKMQITAVSRGRQSHLMTGDTKIAINEAREEAGSKKLDPPLRTCPSHQDFPFTPQLNESNPSINQRMILQLTVMIFTLRQIQEILFS